MNHSKMINFVNIYFKIIQLGASGVMTIVPILTMFFKMSVHTTIGTSLFVDVIASLTVSYSYFKNSNIDLKSGI